MSLDIHQIRADFPILSQTLYGKPLVYFDNGATTQKPKQVIDVISDFYSSKNSNIHRGVHFLSDQATQMYEDARATVTKFIGASSKDEIVFTKGTTESINLVAFSYGEKFVSQGDEIIVSEMEHHSNIVPWQLLCERKKATLKVIPFNDNGELMLEKLDELITSRTKIISVTYVSNSLGTINPVKEIIEKAHSKGIPVLIDAAQAIQHISINVVELDCDFLAFSGHKIYAETGIGVLYGKEKWLNEMPPYQGGGDMIDSVSFEKTTYNHIPLKFEAGTSNIVGAISLAKAMDYISAIGLENIQHYEQELLSYATQKLSNISNLKIIGTAKEKTGVFSFILQGIHPYDTGMVLDKMAIAVRTGTHCTEPVMKHFDISGTVRASFSFYNTKEEIDKLYDGLLKINQMFF